MEIDIFLERIREQFEESDAPSINKEVDFKALPTWDSLTATAILVMIIDEYDVKIGGDDFRSVITLEELFNLVVSKRAND